MGKTYKEDRTGKWAKERAERERKKHNKKKNKSNRPHPTDGDPTRDIENY